LVEHFRNTAFMGFIPVITHLRSIFHNLDRCKKDIIEFQPDAVILIDYSGFNLRIAKFAKAAGFTVFYYISPQVWAWRKSRVKKIKDHVDRLFSIIPFEKEFYAKRGVDVEYVGHPLLDIIDLKKFPNPTFRADLQLSEKPLVALLPGSRKQEIKSILPVMAGCADRFPDYEFVIAGMSTHENEFYESIIAERKIKIAWDRTYDLLENAHAALVTSGTATIETAIHRVPQVVCYKGNYLSYLLVKNLVDIDFISMVNLIMGKKVVTELIQNDFTIENLTHELQQIVEGIPRTEQLKQYDELIQHLGGPGASNRAAKRMIKYLHATRSL